MLRDLKLSLLRTSRAVGLFRLAQRSGRRNRQLLILCYHGVSIDDEHRWAPGLYISQETFASRLAMLDKTKCSVLSLGEGIRRLYEGTLPDRSVAITFDDGNFDFYSRAWPLLRDAGLPVTVYLTTYYCENNLPIFPLAVSYLLWKGHGRAVSLHLGPRHIAIDTRSVDARRRSQEALLLHAQDEELSAAEKDQVAAQLADALGIDYADLRRRRLLHIMNEFEARELAAQGVDFQLHTHRHRSPLDRRAYAGELADNGRHIATYTGRDPRHFCYPSGVHMPQFDGWLEEQGILSATTCEPGMATRHSSRFSLPRLLDHSDMTPLEFEAWLTGVGAMLPRRTVGFQPVDQAGRLVIRRPPVAGPRMESPVAVASPPTQQR